MAETKHVTRAPRPWWVITTRGWILWTGAVLFACLTLLTILVLAGRGPSLRTVGQCAFFSLLCLWYSANLLHHRRSRKQRP